MLKEILENEVIYLREIKFSDVNQNYHRWMNNPQIIQFTESRFSRWTINKLKNYVQDIKHNPDYLFLAIVLKKNDKHIGNIKLGPINKFHKSADIGIMIGEESFWGKGIALQAIRLLVDYAFNKLGIHKITAGVYSNNIGSIKAFKRAGFIIEGRRKKQCLFNEEYTDIVLLGIINE